jgi:hypothetical protein
MCLSQRANELCWGLRTMSRDREVSLANRLLKTLPVFAVALGVAATIAWLAFLGWLVVHVARFVL